MTDSVIKEALAERDTEIERLRAAIEPFAAIGRRLNAVDEGVWPSNAKARFLNLDSITVGHFREAGRVVEHPRERAMQELADQAQALNMGYGSADGQSRQRPENLGRCPIDGKECDCIMPCSIDGQYPK